MKVFEPKIEADRAKSYSAVSCGPGSVCMQDTYGQAKLLDLANIAESSINDLNCEIVR